MEQQKQTRIRRIIAALDVPEEVSLEMLSQYETIYLVSLAHAIKSEYPELSERILNDDEKAFDELADKFEGDTTLLTKVDEAEAESVDIFMKSIEEIVDQEQSEKISIILSEI